MVTPFFSIKEILLKGKKKFRGAEGEESSRDYNVKNWKEKKRE